MRLRKKYSASGVIGRLTTVGNKSDYVDQNDPVVGQVQPLDSAYSALIGGNLSKSFNWWVSINADVKIGDRVVIALGAYADTYFVKELKKFAIGSMKHLEIIMDRKDA